MERLIAAWILVTLFITKKKYISKPNYRHETEKKQDIEYYVYVFGRYLF
jgi:hypothetical protein